jgi:Flp pilus assembly pilin Flp
MFFRKRRKGASILEYAVLAAFMAGICMLAAYKAGGEVRGAIDKAKEEIESKVQ